MNDGKPRVSITPMLTVSKVLDRRNFGYASGNVGSFGECVHQYSHNFLVGACTGLYKPVQALKVESLQEKQAMSDFPQVWSHFA